MRIRDIGGLTGSTDDGAVDEAQQRDRADGDGNDVAKTGKGEG